MDNTSRKNCGDLKLLDDDLIVSKLEYNWTVGSVLSKLDKEVFVLKLSKCEFSAQKTYWLCFDIDDEGYKPKLSKVPAVFDLKSSKNFKSAMVFNGSFEPLAEITPISSAIYRSVPIISYVRE